MGESARPGDLSRRDALRRGALLGGATMWATPIVQSLTIRPAFAQATPAPAVEGPSYIAMNVTCSGAENVIKLEEKNGSYTFADEPGRFPSCDEGDPPLFTPYEQKADGDNLNFTFSGPDQHGCVTVLVPDGCEVDESVVKDAYSCCSGPTGIGTLLFCHCD